MWFADTNPSTRERSEGVRTTEGFELLAERGDSEDDDDLDSDDDDLWEEGDEDEADIEDSDLDDDE